jgi:hypothetical protein
MKENNIFIKTFKKIKYLSYIQIITKNYYLNYKENKILNLI